MDIMDIPIVAFLGLVGWHEYGRNTSHSYTYSRGPLEEHEVTAPIRVDLRPALDCSNPALRVWIRPTLNLDLPDDNICGLFEGCNGSEGTTEGHPWVEGEEIRSFDSVGLNVYLRVLQAQGAIVEHQG